MPVDATEKYSRIVEAYRRTLSTRKVADDLGYPIYVVTRAVKMAGLVPSRGKGVCYDHVDEIRQWVSDGVTLVEIARRIGSKHQTVRKFLQKHNIPWERRWRTMENHPRWKGGRMIDQDGYVLVKCPEHPNRDRHNYVREHRLVMEQILGRYLDPQEVVHHKDGDKQNNHPDNLEVFGSNPEHLAETLKGQVPNWTPEGMERMREASRQMQARRRKSSRAQ